MPTYPPRTEPVKKQQQLAKTERELSLAIKKNVTADKLEKIITKYRLAQVAVLKAKIHTFKENEFQNKKNNTKIEKLEKLIVEWTNKTSDDIINEVKKSGNL